mgnify:CR=1 FL=1
MAGFFTWSSSMDLAVVWRTPSTPRPSRFLSTCMHDGVQLLSPLLELKRDYVFHSYWHRGLVLGRRRDVCEHREGRTPLDAPRPGASRPSRSRTRDSGRSTHEQISRSAFEVFRRSLENTFADLIRIRTFIPSNVKGCDNEEIRRAELEAGCLVGCHIS